ncbi:membrane-associated, eicosanoid/glutathione metabolism protein [Aspergillus leporis]|uniref:Membrane-associated, eicosanoid/glutathione metabolism protein n=1 Tax=Aspergillus leporis TaxID=41062 RepID=A0A5N5WJN3_9EURO|nr:membrane-associated, eicosanoid/glutathione metabolism protein [Aspergillus leporis]
MSSPQISGLLAPIVTLNAWTFVMEFWMYRTRIPTFINLKFDNSTTKAELDAMTPPNVRWKADNFNHLLEQPTQFYAIALVLAVAGNDNRVDTALAWSYVGVRIVHSLVHSTSNKIMRRFGLFVISSGILATMTARAAMLVF